MKTCEYGCGAVVTFVMLDEDAEGKKTWSPPMESWQRTVKKGRAEGFEFPPLVVTEHYVMHECPQRAAAKAKALEDAQWREHLQRSTAKAWEVALLDPCPKCDVAAGTKCANLSDRRRARPIERETVAPHKERLPVGWSYDG